MFTNASEISGILFPFMSTFYGQLYETIQKKAISKMKRALGNFAAHGIANEKSGVTTHFSYANTDSDAQQSGK